MLNTLLNSGQSAYERCARILSPYRHNLVSDALEATKEIFASTWCDEIQDVFGVLICALFFLHLSVPVWLECTLRHFCAILMIVWATMVVQRRYGPRNRTQWLVWADNVQFVGFIAVLLYFATAWFTGTLTTVPHESVRVAQTPRVVSDRRLQQFVSKAHQFDKFELGCEEWNDGMACVA